MLVHQPLGDTRAAAVAHATGLALIQGSPTALLQMAPWLRMRGAPHGRDVVLEVIPRDMHARGSLRLPVATTVCFEIRSRARVMQPLMEPPRRWPPASFGDRALDGHLEVRAHDPRLGPLLAPWARVLAASAHLVLVCERGALEVRTIDAGTAVLGDAPMLLLVMEEMARALEGRRALSEVGADAPARVRALSCERCGANAREVPAGVHEPIVVWCDHCRGPVRIGPEATKAIRALRARASIESRGRALVQVAEASAEHGRISRAAGMVILGGPFVLMAVSSVIALLMRRVEGGAARALLDVLFAGVSVVAPCAPLALVLAMLVLWRRQKRHAGATERAPAPTLACSSCGAPLVLAGAVSHCTHCGADNLADRERLRRESERAARAGLGAHDRAASELADARKALEPPL